MTRLYEIFLTQEGNIEKRKTYALGGEQKDDIEGYLISENKVKIVELIGNNGKIDRNEFAKNSILNTLTKHEN